MAPTRPSQLVAVALAGLVAGWALVVAVDRFSAARVPVSWVTAGLLVFFAAALLVAARTVRGWVAERRYDAAMDALRAARMVALAKAGLVFGAAVVGGYLGVALGLSQQGGSEYAADSIPAALGIAAAGVLVLGAAWYLEVSCISPGSPDDDDSGPGTGATPA